MVAVEQSPSRAIEGGLELAYPAWAIGPSSQLEYTPLALWMVDALKPNTIVAVGVDDGNVYFAFLQAVQALGLRTDCTGIRLEGLPHRHRDEEVFGSAKAYHDALYSRFSALARSSLAGALAQVSGNIDLLYIHLAADGDAVARDLEEWLPKMSSRGVVLLHPTEARPPHENVRQFWKILASRYPSFEFAHAQGLGLAYVGTDSPPEQIRPLLRAREDGAIERIRGYFSRLGASVSERHALRQAEAAVAALKAELARGALGAAPTESLARVAAQRNVAIRLLRQQALAAMRPKREAVAFSKNALLSQIVQHTPERLKRLLPLSVKHQILRLLTPQTADPVSDYVFPDVATDIDQRVGIQLKWLQPYFSSVGLDDEPAVTFLELRSAGYPVYLKLTDAERVAQLVRKSDLFDHEYYLANAGDIGDLDPALHYVIVGERLGFAPSSQFDPGYYLERYPDLRRSFECLLVHYVTSGRGEGRRPTSLAAALAYDRSRIDPQRETILVVAHEASRTGAPILGYNIVKRLAQQYNVVTLLLSGGDIASAFADVSHAVLGPLRRADWHPVEADHLVRHILSAYRLSYAIANSIDTRIVMRPLSCAFVPVVALVHEFPSYLPAGEMGRELGWATQSVFSAARVLNAARADHPNLDNYRVHILPQGPPELPPAQTKEQAQSQESLQAVMRPAGYEDAFVVLGCGTIYQRKGVDLFMACAAAVAKQNPERRIRFVWIGQVLPPELDQGFFSALLKQIERAGIADKVAIVEEVADLEPAYQLADAFFLSSRLDPLPNVAIDSALRGLPVVCFENCSGISDILSTDIVARSSVVPHLDAMAAAKLIVTLAADEPMRQQIGAAARRLAEANFDMGRYIARLDDIGRESMKVMQQRRDDFATIEDDEVFDTISFLGPDSDVETREDAIRLFIAKSAMLGTGRQPTVNFYYRRPCPGFHPQIYAHENRSRYDIASVNPLAHFIREGKPEGPWSHSVITPDSAEPGNAAASRFRIALHVHFHYPELCGEFLDMMASNQTRCDLLLTTNSRRKARMLTQGMAAYGRGDVHITIVPNRGRDIGAFLTGLSAETMEQYDFIGHLHSKRSLFLDDRLIGERWRKFIWRNLIGQQHPMMDIVLGRMAKDPRLGIVFPDDPHLSDWDYNLGIAERLAQQIGMQNPLPPFFNFPVGTMFWARSAALAPLFKLNLDWSSYPKEPAPIDGTILHALERKQPFVAQHAGYRYATTHVPGVTW
ncbi:MAG: hypothetical protein QOH67_4929 [Hyphomicrobiales bacterium]|nr:hypothetical protein [Hyphomicrobiales bacterium]